MLGKDLKHLSAVSELQKLDIENGPLTLHASDGKVTALYVGPYSSGWRTIQDPATSEYVAAVHGVNLASMASLFPNDKPIKLDPQPGNNRLMLTSKGSSTALAMRTDVRQIEEAAVITKRGPVSSMGFSELGSSLKVAASAFADEVDVASAYVSENNLRPILTGIRVQSSKNRLFLTAHDGFSLIYSGRIDNAQVNGNIDITLPAVDFLLGLKLVGGADDDLLVCVSKDNANVIIYNAAKTALFRTGTIHGSWPNVEEIMNMNPPGSTITLTDGELKALSVASKTFNNREVQVSNVKDRAVMAIKDATGGYQLAAAGEPPSSPIAYDVEALSKLTRMGDTIKLTVPSVSGLPTYASAGKRRCWVASRV